MFAKYYQTELAYLREMGREFAQKHPALASMLAERGVDPDVERLLEGFAFVAARMRQRIDDSYPEFIEPLCELLSPHILRPTPAATILEFKPSSKSSRGRMRVEAQRRVLSRNVRGTACTFSTTRSVDILPVRVTATRVDETAASRPTLTLEFEAEAGAASSVFSDQPLRLHLHGEPALTTQLHLWLRRHVSGVALIVGEQSYELATGALKPSGWGGDDTLVPWPAFSPHGVRVLWEYFTLPAKFSFFEVHGLSRAAGRSDSKFKIVVRFSSPPPLATRVPDDAFRLNCVPAVNLFAADAEPIRTLPGARPTLLRAAGMDPLANEVFCVRAVTGIARGGERHSYGPFHSFQHMRAEPRRYYVLSRQLSPVDDGVHSYLSTGSSASTDEVLSVDLLCTNRSLPGELQVGDINLPTGDIPPGLSVRNISRVSSSAHAPLSGALPWALISHLACTRRSLSDVQALRSQLALYCSPDAHDANSRANKSRIEAIRSVSASTITRVLGCVAATGSLFTIELDERAFVSVGDAFIFGTVLHQLLQNDARVNTFADLVIRLSPSDRSYRYNAELEP